MSDRSLFRENINLRWVILASALVAVGVGLLLLPLDSGTRPREIAAGLGPALISIGVIGIGYEVLLRRSVIRETLAIVGLEESIARRGVLEVGSWVDVDSKLVEFFRANPGDIDICFGYGHTWSIRNAERVLRLSAESDRRVRIILLDPEPPDEPQYLEVFALEFSSGSTERLQEKVNDSIGQWLTAVDHLEERNLSPRLVIEGIRSTVPYTFYRAGDAMWVVFSARRRRRVAGFLPAIHCAKTGDPELGLFDWVMEDLETCRSDSVTRVLYPESTA